MAIPFNCDISEGFGLYYTGDGAALMAYIAATNVACGFYVLDPSVIARAVRLARARGVEGGAHPSLPDLQGFGQRKVKIGPDNLGIFNRERIPLDHIKPRGALYGMAPRTETIARAIACAVTVFGVAPTPTKAVGEAVE